MLLKGSDRAVFRFVVDTFVLFSLERGESKSEENFLTISEMRGDMRLVAEEVGELSGEFIGESTSTFNTFAHLRELKLVVPKSGSSTTGKDSNKSGQHNSDWIGTTHQAQSSTPSMRS